MEYPLLCSSVPYFPSLRSHQIFTCAPCPSFVWGRPVDSAKEKRVSARKRGTERPRNERAKLGLQAAGGRARGRRRRREEIGTRGGPTPPAFHPIRPRRHPSRPTPLTPTFLSIRGYLLLLLFRRCEHCEGANTRPQNGSSSRLKVRNLQASKSTWNNKV